MDLRQLTPQLFVSPQIDPADLPQLAAQGFTRVMCNRPDAEVPPSHAAEAMANAAKDAGIEFVCQPLTHQTMTAENIANNARLIGESDAKVLAYCASGTRSTIAWALSQAGKMSAEDIIRIAADAGYDLSQLRDTLGG